jgi:diacylglycerol kinase family enzyme
VAHPAEQAPHQASSEPGHPVPDQIPPQKYGFFAHALTVGLNVQFARLATNVATRQRYGRLTYPVAALEVLRNHAALEMQLEFHGLAFFPPAASPTQPPPSAPQIAKEPILLQCRALQAAVINAPIFGGRWQLAVPGASLTDRLLDIVVVEDVEWGSLSSRFANLFNQQERPPISLSDWHARYPMLHPAELTGIPGMHHVRAQGVTITTSLDPQDVTLDGEVRGQTPMHVLMADQRLRVIVPQETSVS